MNKIKNFYIADFETSSEEWLSVDSYARVWLFDLCWSGKHSHVTGTDISEFIDVCRSIATRRGTKIYFHNLKFDGHFIVDYILRNENKEDSNIVGHDTILSDMGIWYEIRVEFDTGIVRFLDSYKLLPISVAGIARTFELPISKLHINYEKYREPGYRPTETEIEYVRSDTEIVCLALERFFARNLRGMTLASASFNNFKNTYQKWNYDYLFPVLDIETDDTIRLAYKGGYTYLKPEYEGVDLDNVTVLDINSMYPWQMREGVLPYGVPVLFTGKYEEDKRYPLYIQHIKVMFQVKHNHLPTIQIKGNFRFIGTEYLKDSGDDTVDLVLTKPDLELFLDHYEIEYIEYIDGMKFHGQRGIFDEFVDNWIHEKETSTGGQRFIAKRILNSCYGKTAMNPHKFKKVPVLIDDEVKYVLSDEELSDPVYTACAAFITAYARSYIIREGQKHYDRIIYFDTDSMHLLGHEIPGDLWIDDNNLGSFKVEEQCDRARYLRAKTYIHETNGVIEVKAAGMPKEAKEFVTWENFRIGAEYTGKLTGKRVKGGYVLVETTFKISK